MTRLKKYVWFVYNSEALKGILFLLNHWQYQVHNEGHDEGAFPNPWKVEFQTKGRTNSSECLGLMNHEMITKCIKTITKHHFIATQYFANSVI